MDKTLFFKKYSNLQYISFADSRLLKEHNFDAFAIDLKYINGKFNSVINR